MVLPSLCLLITVTFSTPTGVFTSYCQIHSLLAINPQWSLLQSGVPCDPGGVFFNHGQEGDQFAKVDREFCHLDLWRRRFVAAGSLSSFHLEGYLKLMDERVR
jgi:hypothetical protein